MFSEWAIIVIIGLVTIIAGFIVTTYFANRKPLQILGQALYIIGIVVVVIGLIFLAGLMLT